MRSFSTGTPHNRILLLIAAIFVIVGITEIRALFFPYQLSYAEGYMIEQGWRWATDQGTYGDLTQLPWIADNFPPVYLAVMGIVYQLSGADFLLGRLLTLLAASSMGYLLYQWYRDCKTPPWIAFSLLALWLASPILIRRLILIRMDYAAILFSGAGLFWFLRNERSSMKAVLGSSLCFVLAVFTKQSAVAAPGALFLALIFSGRRREAAALALLSSSLIIAGVLIMQWSTEDRFLEHIVSFNNHRWFWGKGVLFYLIAVAVNLPLFFLAITSVAKTLSAWPGESLAQRSLCLWFLLSAFTALVAAKGGSVFNQFLELLWVSAMLAPLGLETGAQRIAARWRTGRQPGDPVPLFLSCVLTIQLGFGIAQAAEIHYRISSDTQYQLVERLRRSAGPVLSENAAVLLQAGQRPLIEPRMIVELTMQGVWDEAPLLDSLQGKVFAQLVLSRDRLRYTRRFSPNVLRAIRSYYERTEVFGPWEIWTPKKESQNSRVTSSTTSSGESSEHVRPRMLPRLHPTGY